MSISRPLTGAAVVAAVIVATPLMAPSSPGPTVVYVDDDAPPGGDGMSWASAYRFLQDALGHAGADPGVVEIRVAQGVYLPDRDEANPDPGYADDPCCVPGDGCDDRSCRDAVCAELPYCCGSNWTASCAEAAFQLCDLACPDRHARFELVAGVPVVGGFAGIGAPDPDARDVSVFESVLSGDLFGDDLPDFESRGDNTYQIVVAQHPGQSRLDGLTITGGNTWPGASPLPYGAVAVLGGTLIVADCMLVSNEGFFGGTIYNESDLVVERCSFYYNRAYYGGAIINLSGSMTVISSTFKGNYGTSGGAITCWTARPSTIANCLFSINHGSYGGCVSNVGSELHVSGSTFSGNRWGHAPGGSAVLNFISQDAPTSTTLLNCVFFGNEAPGVGSECPEIAPVAGYCVIEGGYDGIGILDVDPMFVRNPGRGPDGFWGTGDDDFGDLHLLPGSPAIDAGDNTGIPFKTTDLDGNPRLVDDPDMPDTGNPIGHKPIVDMGAYELQPVP